MPFDRDNTELKTILMAEDDPDHKELIKFALGIYAPGVNIVALGDGQEVLNYLFQPKQERSDNIFPPNVILLDLKLPKISGLEVLKRIKQDDILNDIPVYILTTSSDIADMERCYAAGVSRFLTKPSNFEAFKETVQELIRLTRRHYQGTADTGCWRSQNV